MNNKIIWQNIIPSESNDWINQTNDVFKNFIPIQPAKKFDLKSNTFFIINSMGIGTSRDSWVYNYSFENVQNNMTSMIEFYNSQVSDLNEEKRKNIKININDFIESNSTKISWSSSLIPKLEKGILATFELKEIIIGNYRPFCKQQLYKGDLMIHRRGQQSNLFPSKKLKNVCITIPGLGERKGFAALIFDSYVDTNMFDGGAQCFPLYYFEENNATQQGLFDTDENEKYVRRDAISDFILERAKKIYGKNVSKEDIFYYVYGFLHSNEYIETFVNDLKKMLPRLPLVDDVRDFWKFSKAGRALADLHLNYETVSPFAEVNVSGDDSKFYTVEKMRFPKKDQKDTINYNSKITITNIPSKAYEYVVNGKSAIEWIMERYAVATHKESQITNNPNDWAEEVGNPRYILDLLLSIINVSVQTVDIVNDLPKIDFGAESIEGKEVNLYPTREEGDNLSIAPESNLEE